MTLNLSKAPEEELHNQQQTHAILDMVPELHLISNAVAPNKQAHNTHDDLLTADWLRQAGSQANAPTPSKMTCSKLCPACVVDKPHAPSPDASPSLSRVTAYL
jgi:hypothetical protein